MLLQSLQILRLNLLMESRSRLLLSTALAFAVSALLTAIFALEISSAKSSTQSGMIWLILLFAALNAIARLFTSERDQQTLMLLRANAHTYAIYLGKLLFNFLFLLIFSAPILLSFLVLLNLDPAQWGMLLLVLILSDAALAASTTLLAMIVAQTDQKASIFAVISVPVLFPALLISVELTQKSVFADPSLLSWSDLLPLVGFCGAMLTAGALLFNMIWD